MLPVVSDFDLPAATISSYQDIVAGEYDHLPEQAFYMVGGIDEAVAKAESM